MITIEAYLSSINAEMTSADVLEVVQLLSDGGVEMHIDGGWGVDALLGRQTRPHEDLDIAVQHRDVPKLRALFASRGYEEILRDDTRACNFVLADRSGHMVDVHSYTFDAEGNTIFGCPYPVDALTGKGTIAGHEVDCIAPKQLVEFHTGYELDLNDYRDVSAICEAFGLELPPEYNRFKEGRAENTKLS